MKYDFHCHTKEGSIDAKVDVLSYARFLKGKGFQGMMVTDHNSYKGYRAWLKQKQEGLAPEDFTVLRGIEYDTLDAGHILVIMPDHVELKLLELRGMPVQLLARVVHKYGGILGPAHPYGAKFLSAMCSKRLEKDPSLIHEFDFVEAFNTCETPFSNEKARALARMHGKPMFGGSDSHKEAYIGTAYTELPKKISCCDDLIRLVKERAEITCGGTEREPKLQRPFTKAVLGMCWKVYNRGLAVVKQHARKLRLEEIGLRPVRWRHRHAVSNGGE